MKRDDDEESWPQWLARHGPALVLLARQHCASAADAEDAVQEGFVRFWRSRDMAEDPTAYLFACVRSAAIDVSRRSRRRERHELRSASCALDRAMFASRPEDDELRSAVELALGNLPPEQREVVVLKIWGGLTFAQIAAALNLNPDTAASRYRYALAHLHASTLRQEAAHE